MDTLRMRSTDYRFSGMNPKFVHEVGSWRTFSIRFLYNVGNLPSFCMHRGSFMISAGLAETCITSSKEAILEDIAYKDTYPLKFMQKVGGKISVRVHKGNDNSNWNLTIGCNLQGKWILHWGVTYSDELGSEWDQPPADMRPPGSVLIKDYAVETPLRKSPSSVKGNVLHEIQIDISKARSIAALHFVLKEEETGAWYQHRGADFKVNFLDIFEDSGDTPDRKGFQIWPVLSKILSIVWGRKESLPKGQGEKITSRQEGICEEYLIVKETIIDSVLNISIQESKELDKRLVYFDTDLSGNVCVHWGVCKDDERRWEIPSGPHPPNTHIYKERALRTLLQTKEDGIGCQGVLALDKKLWGLLFVLKVDDSIWVNNMGNNFYVPLQSGCSLSTENKDSHLEDEGKLLHLMDSDETIASDGGNQEASSHNDEAASETHLNAANVSDVQYRNELISEIRNLVSDISSERSLHTKNKESQDSILQEIEKLAAEAYSIFRSSRPIFSEESVSDDETTTTVTVSSGTGSGYEILLQGFNWESNKSGRWYLELSDKAAEIASLGFTVIWLPPPTESVSPEGYMPKDLYNLDSRYGSMEQLKNIVGRFHDVGVKVLGDVVLNHRCAHYQNKNGIWNVFGGQLAWDDRAIVSDDPHFQGRGNKSSGDNFHAAPNIDHSQEFVRNDIKEWLCWLRKEIGYDGWRLDYVRGFWGGYVKQYLNASEPYFSVGEYWDSLSYTYGSMDHNQDAHRQRIVDWINATNGAAGAFDVTTKGILHSALERCEYWRLCDERGNPPGVLGWWPSRAVTFIENHDTGSTQGHWRFPAGKEMQGYAYILTHPGTPTVFYDHIFSHLKEDIAGLISLRNRAQIHCRSNIQINRAERDVYVATVNDKVVVKIGPGYHEPPSGENWVLSLQGKDYQIWEAL